MKRFIIPFSVGFIAAVLVLARIWWPTDTKVGSAHGGPLSPPPELVPFRTPGGILHTNGFIKTETLTKESGSWRGTTSSSIRLNATYRYQIVLRNRWNIYLDEGRGIAFVIAPPFQAQLPVAVDSRSVYEWTESGWGRFDKWDQLEALHREVSPFLERQAMSTGYVEVARGQARITVEEFVADWLLKSKGWPVRGERFVKVYFADEPDIPFPEKRGLKDFLP
ncbi:MAG: hypothetical protein ABJF10_26845 [Chthoniobacter sp.]|uniref:hypothetical protein n=1 Tax=Chthoniobacter sp. TaxID=2510640 RepID=UPI0032A47428